MPDIFYPKTEQDVSDFVFDNYNKSNPIEIVGHGSKKLDDLFNHPKLLVLVVCLEFWNIFRKNYI